MNNPGFFSLGNFAITAAGTQVGDWVTGLEGMLAALLQGRFQWGSGGTACKLYIQTSVDQGQTPIDIACIVFNAVSENEVINLSGLTPKAAFVPSDGALADDTLIDGVLGDRLRAKVVSTGTYAASTLLSVSAVVK